MRTIATRAIGQHRRAAFTTARTTAWLAGACIASWAMAQDAAPLSKADVEALTVGKKLQYVRATDGSTVAFDMRSDGRAYYSPQRTSRNLVIQGTYTIADDGTLCFKWEADKYVSLQDGCFLFRSEGAKTLIFARRNPERALGDVVP